MNRDQIAEVVRKAVEATIYGYDGRLLEGDFWPGHDAIVDAVTDAIMALDGWQTMDSAPRDGARVLASVDEVTRVVAWGKTSHVPIYGFCLADQGAEDFDICSPTAWRPLPQPPGDAG